MANTDRYSRSTNPLYNAGMGMRPDRNSRTGSARVQLGSFCGGRGGGGESWWFEAPGNRERGKEYIPGHSYQPYHFPNCIPKHATEE